MSQPSHRQLPVIVGPVSQDRARRPDARPDARTDSRAEAAARMRPGATLFQAHMLGQTGRRHGLKAGPVHIEAARTAYLSTQWSGPDDRRPMPGILRRTSI